MNRLKKTIVYVLLSTLTTVWGCREDVEEFRPYTPTQEDLGVLLSQTPGASTHTVFQFGGSIPDTTLTTASGVRVFLADTENLFADDAGTPVPCSTCPDLKVEVTVMLSKGDLIARGVPTTTAPGKNVLESAGVVYVQAYCQGKPLQLRDLRYVKVQIPANDQVTMTLYDGVVDDQEKLAGWSASADDAFWAVWPVADGGTRTGYELIARHLGWSNCARPVVEQSSPFCVTLPAQFSALNTQVYLVFENKLAVAELSGNDQSSKFCFPEAPLGHPVRVVAVSKTGGQYWLTNYFTEIGSNVELNLSPQPMLEQEVINFLKAL